MKNFCAKETTFDVEFLTNVYPLVAVFKPKAQRSLFDSENYNVDENGEIGSIQIAFGTTTKVQSSLRFKMDAKLLKKFIKLTEKVGLLYLHAFFENQAAGTYEAWQAAQADAALKAAAIKQTAEDARSGEQNAEYRVEVYVYDLLENSKPNLSDLDYTLTGSDLYEVKKLASDRLEEICREKNVPAGKAFTFEVFSYCGEERIDGDEGSATWNGSEVVIDNDATRPAVETLPRRRCVICGDAIKDEYGHDAHPIAAGKCCDVCNYSVVVPARIAASKKEEPNDT